MDEVDTCDTCGTELCVGEEFTCEDCLQAEEEEEQWASEYEDGKEYAAKVSRHLSGQTQAFNDGFLDVFN